jgi:hypothetical protein
MKRLSLLSLLFAMSAGQMFADTRVSLGRKPVWPEPPFTPEKHAYAQRLVRDRFALVADLRSVDPSARAAFYKIVPRRQIAVGNEPFNATDVVSGGRPRRFRLAGHHSDLWFVLYEVGASRANHDAVLIFQRDGTRWRQLVAATGYVESDEWASFVKALKTGRFHEVFTDLNL